MRLKKHITEQHTDGTLSAEQATFVEFMTNILRDCQPFLRDLDLKDPRFLYSGRKRDTDWFEQKVRSDRKPKDLSKDIHADFDNEFNKQFGWRPRSNGLFCTGSEASAFEYGKTYMIFPKGQFKFLWNDKITDLYIYIQRKSKATTASHDGNVLYQFFYNKLAKEMSDGDIYPDETFIGQVAKEYNEFVTNTVKSYKSTNLKDAIKQHSEIMVNCQTYYAVDYDQWHMKVNLFFRRYGNKMPPLDELLEFME